MALILDACAIVHASSMSAADKPLLQFLDELLALPTYLLTQKVKTEVVKNGAGAWVQEAEELGRLTVVRSSFKAARQRRRKLSKRYKAQTPGDNDIGLLVLATERAVPLVTDDHDFYRVALDQHSCTFDLFDVALASMDAGELTKAQAVEVFSGLASNDFHAQPYGWSNLRKKQSLTWPDGFDQFADTRRSPAELMELLSTTQ